MATKWEYHILKALSLSGSMFNNLGSIGWELVSLTQTPAASGTSVIGAQTTYTIVFKREILTVSVGQTESSSVTSLPTAPSRG